MARFDGNALTSRSYFIRTAVDGFNGLDSRNKREWDVLHDEAGGPTAPHEPLIGGMRSWNSTTLFRRTGISTQGKNESFRARCFEFRVV
jgi:hypothetical protein